MLRPTLTFKFIALISLILIITFACIAFFLIRHQKDILYSDLKTLSISLSRNLSANSVYGLLTRNIKNLSGLLNSLSNYEDVAFAWIEDNSGQVLATHGTFPSTFRTRGISMFKKQFHGMQYSDAPLCIMQESSSIWLIRQPVFGPRIVSPDELILGTHNEDSATVKIGEIYVGISLKRVSDTLHTIQLKSLALLAGVAIFSLVLTFIVVHWISLPLKKLRQATEHVTAGVLPPGVEIKSRDEIGELAEAFNNMIEQISQNRKTIEQAYRALEQVNQSLEETVAERTTELRSSVTDLTRARDDLEAAYSEMKQMYHAKAAFLRSASHELRTPLTAIKANVDYMWQYCADSLGTEGMEIIGTVRTNVNSMQFMVEEMLKMVRLDTGDIPLDMDSVKVLPLIRECIGELNALQPDIHIDISVDDSLVMHADKTKFHDVFINILTNAYRYTPDHGNIYISGSRKDGRVFLEIRDTGEGIQKEHLSHLFEPFYQAHQGRGGTGLGLSIVKSIIDRHKGSISIKSSPGQGTALIICIPDKA